MAQAAKKVTDISAWGAGASARATSIATKGVRSAEIATYRGKKFEQLNASEKDILLKVVAVRLGLLTDSDNQ